MMLQLFYLLVIIVVLVNCVENDCNTKETCDECIRTATCVWCSDPNVTDSIRCTNRNFTLTKWCSNNEIVDPKTFTNVTHDKLLSSSKEEVVQLRPQRMHLRLRVGQIHEFTIQYRRVQDYPVDLYYLMDLSKSMEEDKDKLSELGDQLSDTMKKLTKDFRIGFGSFVDKVVMPFTSTVPEKLKSPCTLSNRKPCAPPYGFKNNMPLTKNTQEFKHKVKNAPVSGNLDSPEGTLDAIMQAMVCTNEIGWRKNATRLLVVTTDAGYHLAGDGRLAGLIEPNDEQCHLNEQGEYTHHNVFDYPSISQIDLKAREMEIKIIFAVTEGYVQTYKNVAARIYGAGYGELSKDSSNVVKLIEDQYKKIVSEVEMTHNASNSVGITFYTKCLGSKSEIQTNKCEKIKNEQVVNFNVTLQVARCPESKKDWNQTIVIHPVGSSEGLTIDIEVICECECSKEDHHEINSLICKSHGNLICGVCKCEENRVGKICECNSNNISQVAETKDCTNPETGDLCSNQGHCLCNQCVCKKRTDPKETIYGPQCQCDNYSCKRDVYGQVCSGQGQGTCDCNICRCTLGWTGETCECSTRSEKCLKPGDDTECSGRGNCTCDGCECDIGPTGAKYSGKYCQECSWCSVSRCDELKDCVECLVDKDDSCVDETCREKVEIIAEKPDEIEITEFQRCSVKDKQKCNFEFYFLEKEDKKKFKVWAVPERSCDTNIWAVIFGVIGFTVLIGLLGIIIWKVVTTIHDKREYTKFEKERAASKWGKEDNPLYKPSTTTVINPTFGN